MPRLEEWKSNLNVWMPNRVQVNHSQSQMLESVVVITTLSLSRGLDSKDFIYIFHHCTIAIKLHRGIEGLLKRPSNAIITYLEGNRYLNEK